MNRQLDTNAEAWQAARAYSEHIHECPNCDPYNVNVSVSLCAAGRVLQDEASIALDEYRLEYHNLHAVFELIP